ncbi:MAG: hypothetical protein MSC30_03050 [Gaiellaceae bacterium MAG52_C11]|nr:hypothetical protein [Candidatus Gaiellasilicea maunaloa]
MEAAAVSPRETAASDLLLAHCFALDCEEPGSTALVRLEALLGPELAHRLLRALGSRR